MQQELKFDAGIPETTSLVSLKVPAEWKLIRLRECPMPGNLMIGDTPARIVQYWQAHVEQSPLFNPCVESAVVLFLNTRARILGHCFVATGTIDTVFVHPREVFRAAITANAASIVLAHNHPSGESEPSEADIRVTREIARAGQILKISLTDHLIIGRNNWTSLRQSGVLGL